jgi:hypothetical protein
MRTGSLLFRFQNGGYEDDATPPQVSPQTCRIELEIGGMKFGEKPSFQKK